ncbi:MAG TPA: NUDIX domain-containing protein, partial [Candidatus Eisenbacteria bacterium]|nr:NUDIX domain-containing protein [Candidatus Eisenbacteria bacterium]
FPCPRCGRAVRRVTRGARREIRCPRCRYLMFDYPRPCAGAVVARGGDVLVLRRAHPPRVGRLDIPGGFMEAGEGIEHAARRELREETGLTVGRMEPLGMWWDRYPLRGFGAIPTMNFYFLARWRGGEPVAADDAASAEWMPVATLARLRRRHSWRHMGEVIAEVRRRVARSGRQR